MRKRIYMNEEELRNMEILTSNDYIGEIISTRWVDYLGVYEVVVGFDSKEELKQFCNMYGYKTSRIGGDNDLLVKTES